MQLRKVYRNIIPEDLRHPLYTWRRKAIPAFKKTFVHYTDRNVRTMTARLLSLKNAYADQRCIIMGNGPSLNKMDLCLFSDEYVWASNKAYLLFDRISWRPKFYVAVDTRVVPDIADEINILTAEYPDMYSFFPLHFREKWNLKSRENVYWYPERALEKPLEASSMFTDDASEWVSNVYTVTVAAMQLSVYLGFNPIYLIGCDTDYKVPSTVLVEDETNYKLVSTENDDMNHFDPKYFGKGAKWHQPYPHKMIFHFQKAKEVCDELGIQVYNSTVGGKLEEFPRVDYRDLF